MDPDLYPRMAQVEDRHWWFAARRAICEELLDRLNLAPESMILEAGCGTGGNFAMLARRGALYAMDSEPAAIAFAQSRGLARIERGSLPEHIPFAPIGFDLVVMTDVLEHLDDDRGALEAIRARIKPGGYLLATVPAMPSLWSEHDGAHHHLRRYRASGLRRIIESADFDVHYLSYYNIALFPAIAAVRTLQRLRASRSNGASPRHDLAMPPEAINTLLFKIFSSERHLIGAIRFPFGVSLIALARVPAHR